MAKKTKKTAPKAKKAKVATGKRVGYGTGKGRGK